MEQGSFSVPHVREESGGVLRADTGGPSADLLFTELYDELHKLARREVWRSSAQDLVGTTTLVHEVWLHVSGRAALSFEDRSRFLAYASRTMRGLVIDRIRARQALKRGGGMIVTSLDTGVDAIAAEPDRFQRISDALDELQTIEPDLARVVDLKFFCGFTFAEVANMQGVAERTVQRQWRRARLLLFQSMAEN